ncbi:ABC transporter substrate-binding protein [Sciscionella marina]|uniref:ABC transporter substrate-binding protein n=1 Tax=Sciscionella marina TaxID=508770 RepID=UPI0003729E1E|nr:ABC transporter substrate-binding protein [Sciscionella marina]
MSAVYDPLVALDKNARPIPALAKSWKYSADHRELTMHLRVGVRFSDGEPFDAAAAVANLRHLKTGTRSGEVYRAVESITAAGADTVILGLRKRDDALLYFMGLGRSWMAAPAAIRAGTLAGKPVGSGPYTLDTAGTTSGSQYTFGKKRRHWDSGRYPFATVRLFPITDQTASLNAMLSGQLDVNYANPMNIPQARQNGWNIASKVATSVGIQFADHTGKRLKPLGDIRVRQAICYAFDGSAILRAVASGAGTVSDQLFPVGEPGYEPGLDRRYAHDLARARQLMAEAGYPQGFPVTMPMSQPYQQLQPAAEQTLGQLGIRVSWQNMSQPDYQKNAPTYPMFLAVLALDANPAATVVNRITSRSWYNPDPSVNAFPELSRILGELGTAAGDRRPELIRRLDTALVGLAWQNVWYQADNTYFSVRGIKVTPITGMMFPTLRFIQRG